MCHIVKLNKNTNRFEESTIKLVDSGVWNLWVGKSDNNHRIKYALNTGDEYYFLDKDGRIVSKDNDLNNFKRDDIARFSKMKICQVCK